MARTMNEEEEKELELLYECEEMARVNQVRPHDERDEW